jgi:hypothetical protein
MYNMKIKLVIGIVFLLGFGLVVQASSPDALPAAFAKEPAPRKAFQARVIVTPVGNGFQSQILPIPAGKRFIIENVSVITRCPDGLRMEVNFFCYIDNNGDGTGDIADITFHRIALTDQGVFDGTAIASANHKVLVFADEQIGTGHYGITAQARLNAAPPTNPAFLQAQFTLSGYLEDLPDAQ